MHALSFARTGLAQSVLVAFMTLLAVALLGAVLAYWTWAWFAPRAQPRLEPAAQSGSVASAGTVFGTVPRKQAAAAPTGIAIKLLGVVAATAGRKGYAVVQLEAKQILAVHEGEDVAPGVRLAEVLVDHVILERNGVRETLAWPQRAASAISIAPAARLSAQQAAAAAAAQAAATRSRTAGARRKDEE
ncbi:MAG: general secretion pathway protein [Burkholderiales bacterium]|nr:general secretion pathway protein [Burkholderiales bacterium]